MTNDELGALLLQVHGGVKGTAALLESVRHEVERQGKAIGVLVRRTDVLEFRQSGVSPRPEDPPEGANEPHDTAPPREPGSPPDVAALAGGPLPPMRAPAVSLNSEIKATHDSLRVMATAAKESLPILAAAAVSAKESATSSAAAASSSETAATQATEGAAETKIQTPILRDAAKSAAKSVTTAQLTGLANFLAILIVGVIVGVSQRCTPPAAPPGYVMVPATALLPRAPVPTAAPAPAPR